MSEPLYFASIGQVHRAKLKKSGIIVAVKIQFPEIKESILSQLNYLKFAATFAKYGPISRWNITTNSHIAQIENRLLEELNYERELNNLIKSHENSNSSQFPAEIKKYCSSQVLTQPWIDGHNLEYISEHWDKKNKKIVAQLIMSQYLKQILIDGFYQGDTNFSNFIFEENDSGTQVHWIDHGNWCSIEQDVKNSLFSIIFQTIEGDDINYLGHFEKIGFDLSKLRYLENTLPTLVTILFDPFLTNRPYDLNEWKLEERIEKLLGENKWWFRSSGSSSFLELMKSFYGIIKIIRKLEVNINWHEEILKYASHFNIADINRSLPAYENNIPPIHLLATKLTVLIHKDNREHLKIELPAISLLELESLIPDNIKHKLNEKLINIQDIKHNYLKNGLIPGELINISEFDQQTKENNRFNIYLS